MAEAGVQLAQLRRGILAARMPYSARSLPVDDPLRRIPEQDQPRRLKSTTGWRRLGAEALWALQESLTSQSKSAYTCSRPPPTVDQPGQGGPESG